MTTFENVKKRIMFSKGDDFYFLTYNIILILDSFQCYCGKKSFRDFRKLAFLIEFVSNRNLTHLLQRHKLLLNAVDRDLFTRAYAEGLLKLNHIIRLLHALEKQNIVQLSKAHDRDEIDVCLVKSDQIKTFIDKQLFSLELENIEIFKSTIQRSTALTLETMLTKVFDNYGIKTWNDF